MSGNGYFDDLLTDWKKSFGVEKEQHPAINRNLCITKNRQQYGDVVQINISTSKPTILSLRPKRDKIITNDDITNLKIDLENSIDTLSFIKKNGGSLFV